MFSLQFNLILVCVPFFFVLLAPVSSQKPKCGKPSVNFLEGLVTGDENAKQGVWPWIVAIMKKNDVGSEELKCAGSLIDKKHVLSAAHCFEKNKHKLYRVLVGNVDLKRSEPYTIDRIAVPADFKEGIFYDDIAVLTLSREVDFPNFVPICLPPPGTLFELKGRDTTIAGWGSFNNENPSSTLKEVNGIKVLNNRGCENMYRDALPYGITRRMLCGGAEEGNACSSDAGGPLMIQEVGKWFAVGVISYGLSCNPSEFPGVYTRVSEYMDFIKKEMNSGTSTTTGSTRPPTKPPKPTSAVTDSETSTTTEPVATKPTRPPIRPRPPTRPPKPVSGCGSPVITGNPNSRLTVPGEWPWTVSLALVDGGVSCNGVLLDQRTVLTLAFCVSGKRVLQFGMYNKHGSPMETRTDYRTIIHPNYNEVTNANNIAVLKLDSDLPITERIQPVCLPTRETTARNLVPGNEGILSGWQFTDKDTIRKTKINIQSNDVCLRSNFEFQQRGRIGPDQFCTKWMAKWFWNGSPLVFNDTQTGRYNLEGLVSHFLGYTNNGDLYEVFVKVSHFLDWIKENMRG